MTPILDDWHPIALRFDELDGALTHSAVIIDKLQAQLHELMEVRHPAETPSPERMEALIREHLAGTPLERHGAWFHYPWLDRVVHVLPKAEFDEVRLSRNRNKITAGEQARLARLRIGIAGLSVGQASAVTLAMEGVGGQFCLADFDTLSLSNMNRLRAGVHELGLNKAVMTARQMFEINPYLDIRLFPDGVSEATLLDFLRQGEGIDLLIEECDDMYIKLRLREAARGLRIPVLMETSDRGMIDVERFDLEPERPLFHGRINGMRAHDLQGLSNDQKVGVAFSIVGAESVSARMAASAVEIGATLRTWPQLASAIALGAGIVADTARRIALGEALPSGRYYVDLERLVGSAPADAGGLAQARGATVSPADAPCAGVVQESIRAIVQGAAAAPSGGNAQPWRFQWDGRRLRLLIDPLRTGGLLDYEGRATHLALGAAAENALLIAGAQGLRARLRMHPEAARPEAVCDLVLEPGSTIPDPLHEEVHLRATNRRLGERQPLCAAERAALTQAAATHGARLILIEEDTAMTRLAHILGKGDRLRFLSQALHAELMKELRWNEQEARATRDGIDIRTLELSAMDLTALKLTANWRVMDLVGRCGGGRNLERFAQSAARGSSAFGALIIGCDGPRDYFEGGRAMQRLWLTASALGLGLQPMAALPYLFMRAAGGGEGLTPDETQDLLMLRTDYRALLRLGSGDHDLLLFRLAKVAPPSERALRRPVESLLEVLEQPV